MLPTTWLRPYIGLFVALVAAGAARAEENVQVTVVAILASERDKTVDPDLKDIAQQVQKMEKALTGFKLARSTRKSLAVGSSFEFPLVDKETASVAIKHGCDKNRRVGLTVKPPKVGEIVYTSCCGKFFPIVTRYQTKDKERLILAIMVKPCEKK